VKFYTSKLVAGSAQDSRKLEKIGQGGHSAEILNVSVAVNMGSCLWFQLDYFYWNSFSVLHVCWNKKT